jgi:hypothetical protein
VEQIESVDTSVITGHRSEGENRAGSQGGPSGANGTTSWSPT